MPAYKAKSPVLFIVFNRPEQARKVFSRIREVQPDKLYIAADGPRASRPGDAEACRQVREIAQLVDWDCEVKTRFSDVNFGCKVAVSDAITWFFGNEPEGIILEDDCFPAYSFFTYCDELLERYRNDTSIFSVTGTNLQMGRKWGEASYYVSRYTNVWGWASWRRVWQRYDRELSRFPESDVVPVLEKVFGDRFMVHDWRNIFLQLKAGQIDTWDYQFNFLSFFENGHCLVPNVNLISNIGFGEGATHTTEAINPHAAMPIVEMDLPITHPAQLQPIREADFVFLSQEHDLENRWRRYNKTTKRIKRWLKRTFLGKKDL